jgi:hypothetical protein
LDVAYSSAHTSDPDSPAAQTTTGEVAERLEEKWQPMGTFYEQNKQSIAEWLAEDMAASLNDLIKRGSAIKGSGKRTTFGLHQWYEPKGERRTLTSESSSLTYGADQKIERAFRRFLASNVMQTIMDVKQQGGTYSAKQGVSHRFKRPNAKRKARPVFIDTGLYSATFRAWTTKE